MTHTTRLLLMGALAALVGCVPAARPPSKDPPPPPPLEMDPASADQARQWYAQWVGEPEAAGESDVRYAFMIGESAPSGRTGHSCLTCRLVLLDAEYRPIRHDGPIRIVLVAGPNGPDERVVGGWNLDASAAGGHYLYGIMPGYHLDLVWPRAGGAATYRLMVRWSDLRGRASVTTMFHFEDVFGYDVQTTPTTP
ncbi:MAG: hypothetical protein GX591_09285 [Planctomycetes bacterium]|nr:hypothetical protein [Planctomycetota bacterium]